MKGRRSRGVRRSRSRRGGQGVIGLKGSRDGGLWNNPFPDDFLRGGKRPFRKRTCRSKSRCGGAGLGLAIDMPAGLGGSRGGKWWNNPFPFD